MSEETIEWIWVKGRYEGDAAKNIIALVGEGTAYHILKSGKTGTTPFVEAAFKMAKKDGPVPHHLAVLTDFEKTKVGELELRRNGGRK